MEAKPLVPTSLFLSPIFTFLLLQPTSHPTLISYLPSAMSSTPVASRSIVKASRSPVDVSKIEFTSEKQKNALTELVHDFTVTPQLLKDIKDNFMEGMKKGLKKDGETVAMISSYVMGRLDGSGKHDSFAVPMLIMAFETKLVREMSQKSRPEKRSYYHRRS